MDLFTIKGSKTVYNLDVTTYERVTLKQEPYYREGKYYAVCPGCGNTVQIINLYTNNTLDSNKRVVKMHARHCNNYIDGFDPYSEENYNICPFANPLSFGSVQKRVNTSDYNEILDIIKKYPEYLYREINRITGIYFSENKFREMLENFMLCEGYNYKYINKFNLPYGFLNIQKSINIYKQSIYGNKGISGEIKDSINKKSKYFNVLEYKIEKTVPEYAEIKFHFRDHKVNKEAGEQNIELVIFEIGKNKETNEIFKKKIAIDMYSFVNVLNNTNKIRNISNEILNKYD
jgi:hypothetical protein